MFQKLSDSLESVFSPLRGKGHLRERDVEEAMREVRRTLLEADVPILRRVLALWPGS